MYIRSVILYSNIFSYFSDGKEKGNNNLNKSKTICDKC